MYLRENEMEFHLVPASKKVAAVSVWHIQVTQKKRELLKNPTKIEEIQENNLLIEIEPLQLAF